MYGPSHAPPISDQSSKAAVPDPQPMDWYRAVSRLVPGRESRGSGVKFMFFMVFYRFYH